MPLSFIKLWICLFFARIWDIVQDLYLWQRSGGTLLHLLPQLSQGNNFFHHKLISLRREIFLNTSLMFLIRRISISSSNWTYEQDEIIHTLVFITKDHWFGTCYEWSELGKRAVVEFSCICCSGYKKLKLWNVTNRARKSFRSTSCSRSRRRTWATTTCRRARCPSPLFTR